MMILALSEMFRTMTAIGNGSFAGNRFIPLALVLLTLALASPFLALLQIVGGDKLIIPFC